MKKSAIALIGLAAILGGCSNTVQYGDANAAETTTVDFGSTDLQKSRMKWLIACLPLVQLLLSKVVQLPM